MASVRQRGDRWQARVSRNGGKPQVRSFDTKQDATRWARAVEVQFDEGRSGGLHGAPNITLRELIERYMREVLPSRKGAHDDRIRLRAINRRAIADTPVATLTPQLVARYRDERLVEVRAGTVIRELAYLSSIINHARREWGLRVVNPVADVRRPAAPHGRSRTLTADEQARLLRALEPVGRRSVWMQPLVLLALETAMRRGELLALRWSDVNLERRTAHLFQTKNGCQRTVPLSSRAEAVLRELQREDRRPVFPITVHAAAAAFSRATVRAGLGDLRFHDLRHTAITRMADKLPNVIELAAVSGHRSLRMLQRYYHPDPQQLAIKLG